MTNSVPDEPISFEERSARPERRQTTTATPVLERRVHQRRREPLVLDEAFEQFNSVAFGVAMRVTGDRQAADDVTQELFLALWNRPAQEAPAAQRSLRARLADALEGTEVPSGHRKQRDATGDTDAKPVEENYDFAGWLPLGEAGPKAPPSDPGNPTVTVVIPTLNEAKNLPHVFERLPEWIDEVIIVDGNSTDDTIAVATACRPDAKIVTQTGKGKGNALACGFRAATSDITVMLDADGSTDPAEIPRLVAALTNGYDFPKADIIQTRSRVLAQFRLMPWSCGRLLPSPRSSVAQPPRT